jgi:hypothetical protein
MTVPEQCDRAGCQATIATFCPLCLRCFCLEHDELPDGHVCLSAMRFNTSRVLDDDEVADALEHFQPLP